MKPRKKAMGAPKKAMKPPKTPKNAMVAPKKAMKPRETAMGAPKKAMKPPKTPKKAMGAPKMPFKAMVRAENKIAAKKLVAKRKAGIAPKKMIEPKVSVASEPHPNAAAAPKMPFEKMVRAENRIAAKKLAAKKIKARTAPGPIPPAVTSSELRKEKHIASAEHIRNLKAQAKLAAAMAKMAKLKKQLAANAKKR